MKKTLAALLAVVLLTGLCAPVLAEETENDMSLESQMVQMSEWVAEAIACREAGNWAEEAAILETIAAMNDAAAHPGMCHDEIAWPAQARWAHFQLGELYSHEEYSLFDMDRAIEHYTQAAGPMYRGQDSNAECAVYAQAALALGDIYRNEAYGRADIEQAIAWYQQARALGPEDLRPEAIYRLALLYADPAYGLNDDRISRGYLYDAAYAGHPEALALLEELLGDDAYEWALYYDYHEDYDLAIEIMLPAAEQGDERCMSWLAYLYYTGYTGKGPYSGNEVRDVENALYWYTRAAEAGDPEAMEWIATIYLNGDAPNLDEEQVIAWALKAVETGDDSTADFAKIDLGKLYQLRGDYEQAESWYLQAEGWVFLGRLYQKEGYRDVEKAVEYMEKAAGIPDGEFYPYLGSELMGLYGDPEYGPGIDKAAALYKLAYAHGYYRNLYNLANLYLDEENGIADEAQGIYWMYQSAIHGDSRAQEWFEQLIPADGAEEAETE